MSSKEGKNIGIQVLRVISCIMVFMVHFSQIMNFKGSLFKFCSYGEYGVYLFFIISGFLAWYELDKDAINVKHYYLKRFLKIAPLFYIVILVNIITHTFIFKDIPVDMYGLKWWRYFLFIFQIVPSNSQFWINITATWTIGIFAVFYVIAPILKSGINNYKISLFITIITFLLSKYYYLYIKDGYFNFLNYLYPFFFGTTAYLCCKEQKKDIFLIICAVIAFFTSSVILKYVSLFTIILLAIEKIEVKNKIILKFINIIDKYSFGIYLIHALIIDTLYHFDLNIYLNAVIIIGGTVLLSFIITNLISNPIYKWGKKLIKEI